MSTQNIDIKDIAKLPSIKSWKSDELARRMAFAFSVISSTAN